MLDHMQQRGVQDLEKCVHAHVEKTAPWDQLLETAIRESMPASMIALLYRAGARGAIFDQGF